MVEEASRADKRVDVVERDLLETFFAIGLEILTEYIASAGDGDEGELLEREGRKLVRFEEPKRRVYSPILGRGGGAVSETVFQRVEMLLSDRGVPYQVVRHAPVYTSQEAAAVRGTSLASGAKALVCKAGGDFVMFVLPADRKLAGAQARRAKGWRKLRFATGDEVRDLTGLQPGSIPPFGSLFGLPTLCDAELGQNEQINFNAGDHSISISVRYEDYVRVEKPQLGTYSQTTEVP